jgi:hypothetical protein
MPDAPRSNDPADPVAARNLLQQELIATRARLDRQVAQLMRLNKLSNHLLDRMDARPVAEIFAEAVIDVLDVAVGAVWILPAVETGMRKTFSMCGIEDPDDASSLAGRALADRLPQDGRAIRLKGLPADLLPGVQLREPLGCCCVGRDGRPTAVVRASNTDQIASMFLSNSDETLQTLVVLAERCAAHIDNHMDRRTIETQVATLRESQEQLELVLRGTNDGW